MVTLTIKTDFPDLQRRLDALHRDIAGPAMASTLNKAVALAKTQMTREITAEYNVQAGYVRQRLAIRRASGRRGAIKLSAVLQASNKRRLSANIIAFVEKMTSRGEQKKRAKAGTLGQLFVKIKRKGGKKALGKMRFIGNKGRTVFERRDGQGRRIFPVQTIDVASMFNGRRINGAVLRVIRERLPDLFANEAAYYTRRFESGRK